MLLRFQAAFDQKKREFAFACLWHEAILVLGVRFALNI